MPVERHLETKHYASRKERYLSTLEAFLTSTMAPLLPNCEEEEIPMLGCKAAFTSLKLYDSLEPSIAVQDY